MKDTSLRVLVVEDSPDDAVFLANLLTPTDTDSFELVRVDHLEEALCRLRQEHFDVVLLDLGLPDSQGLETFTRVHHGEPGIPTIVLTGLDDRQLSEQAVRHGAQDYLTKGNVSSELLARAIRHAIERHRFLAEVTSNALFDELTGLYNRRGLLAVSGPLFKMVGRMKKELTLLFIDLDHLKQINDNLGHNAGDRALIETSDLLRQTFRESDIVARLGGDEFAVLAVGVSADRGERLVGRLQERLRQHNVHSRRDGPLSLSIGLAHNDPERPSSLEALLVRADGQMYKQKQSKRQTRTQGAKLVLGLDSAVPGVRVWRRAP